MNGIETFGFRAFYILKQLYTEKRDKTANSINLAWDFLT